VWNLQKRRPAKKRKEKASAKQACCGAMKAFTTRKENKIKER
jgi:hypothetical protein